MTTNAHSDERVIRCRTAGLAARCDEEYVDIDVRRHRCGDIVGGVSFYVSALRGPFVVDFESFERAYLAAKAHRAQFSSDSGEKP